MVFVRKYADYNISSIIWNAQWFPDKNLILESKEKSFVISEEDDPVAQNGFQLDAGRGRAFLIKGDLHDLFRCGINCVILLQTTYSNSISQ